jgi:hypothetical protein
MAKKAAKKDSTTIKLEEVVKELQEQSGELSEVYVEIEDSKFESLTKVEEAYDESLELLGNEIDKIEQRLMHAERALHGDDAVTLEA